MEKSCNASMGPFGLCQREAGHKGSHKASVPYTYPAQIIECGGEGLGNCPLCNYAIVKIVHEINEPVRAWCVNGHRLENVTLIRTAWGPSPIFPIFPDEVFPPGAGPLGF